MTQEERQLLLTALCGYLPYKVKCFAEDREYGDLGTLYSVDPFGPSDPNIYIQYYGGNVISFFTSEVKPYLRPISSMTEEEKEELLVTVIGKDTKYFQVLPDGSIDNTDDEHQDAKNFTFHWVNFDRVNTSSYVDWLNANHFDYRGLIGKGLALEANEEMYKKK